MLKNYSYDGSYRDKHLSVSVLLENPFEHGFESSVLVFSVAYKAKNNETADPRLEDFTFYLMEEANRLHNTHCTPYVKRDAGVKPKDDELIRQPDGLIHTDFKHEFLFQNLRLAFYYQPYGTISIIELRH